MARLADTATVPLSALASEPVFFSLLNLSFIDPILMFFSLDGVPGIKTKT